MLFTGSGRHRRQTQAEKAIAVAGVAGVGLALPLLTVTSAHAAPVHTWEKVADCETGGDWGHNTGNGLYGGLQLSPATWEAFGGTEFAPRADLATKSQQITVAERALAANGEDSWAPCSLDAGLGRGGTPGVVDTNDAATESGSLKGSKGVDAVNADENGVPAKAKPKKVDPVFPGYPGYDALSGVYWYQKDGGWYWTSHQEVYQQYAADSTTPATPVTPATPDATATPSATDSAQPQTPTTPTADGTVPAAPITPANPTGTATPTDGTATPVTPATPTPTADGTTPPAAQGDQGNQGSKGNQDGQGNQADQGNHNGQGKQGDQGSQATPAAPATPAAQPYTVQSGDTLSGIAADHAVPGGWPALYQDNQGVVGTNPDLIHPGQTLDLH